MTDMTFLQDGNAKIGSPRLGGINTHTSGMEFYGGSSSLAFLARLFAKARERAGTSLCNALSAAPKNGTTRAQVANPEPRLFNSDQSSLVDLMYNTDYQSCLGEAVIPNQENDDDSANSPIAAAGVRDSPVCHNDNNNQTSSSGVAMDSLEQNRGPSSVGILKAPTNPEDTLIEKYFIEAYFTNVHYIHPLLDEKGFRCQCARKVWSCQPRLYRIGHESKFLALYYAVVALGIINSPDQSSSCPIYYRRLEWDEQSDASNKTCTLELANLYFARARQALGDTMEMSSLETCQALFLIVRTSSNLIVFR